MIRALASFHPAAFVDSLVALTLAFALGGLIGFERQVRQRTAGLRTNVLVAVGAAAFVDLGGQVMPAGGSIQIIAYVVAGIGFLGAGVILHEGGQVRGLNTAATLWCSAAVGACTGAGFAAQAIALTAFVLAGNTLLRPLVNAINRAPVDEASAESTLELWAVTASENVDAVRDLVVEALEGASYPVREIEVETRGVGTSEVVATLISTSGERAELDAVCAGLERSPLVKFASWVAQSGEAG